MSKETVMLLVCAIAFVCILVALFDIVKWEYTPAAKRKHFKDVLDEALTKSALIAIAGALLGGLWFTQIK